MPGYFETETYTYGRSGDRMETISHGYYRMYDFAPLRTGTTYYQYGGYPDEVLTRYTENVSPDDDPDEIIENTCAWNGEDVFMALQLFAQFDEEMKKTEETFLGRECYKYSYVDGFEEYNFYFDKETGLCLKGRLLNGTSWEVTTFTVGYEITPPTGFEDSIY
jgi:hypothetical protein